MAGGWGLYEQEKLRREEEPRRGSGVEGREHRAGTAAPPGRQAEAEQFYKDHRPGESHKPHDPKGVQTKGKEKMSLVDAESRAGTRRIHAPVHTSTLQGIHACSCSGDSRVPGETPSKSQVIVPGSQACQARRAKQPGSSRTAVWDLLRAAMIL